VKLTADRSNYPFYPEAKHPARVFFMTSCGHIVCNDPGHNRKLNHVGLARLTEDKKERCTVCGKGGEADPIDVTVIDDKVTSTAEWGRRADGRCLRRCSSGLWILRWMSQS
jgi:hypothetical protein